MAKSQALKVVLHLAPRHLTLTDDVAIKTMQIHAYKGERSKGTQDQDQILPAVVVSTVVSMDLHALLGIV